MRNRWGRCAALALLIPVLQVPASLAPAAEPRQIEARRLTWADFQGRPDPGSPYDAYTYWSVQYAYDAPVREGEGFRVAVRVWNRLGERSWVKPHVLQDPTSAELLNHEQGHYTLGLLCALTFKKAVAERRFGKDYHAEIRRLFSETLATYVTLEKTYDAETRHMRDRAAQKAWDQRLARMVEERWADR